jgi:hypothetical protein
MIYILLIFFPPSELFKNSPILRRNESFEWHGSRVHIFTAGGSVCQARKGTEDYRAEQGRRQVRRKHANEGRLLEQDLNTMNTSPNLYAYV